MCSEIVFERSWGASGWLGSEAGRSPCWSETTGKRLCSPNLRCGEDLTDADVIFSSVCSCSNDCNGDVKFNFIFTIKEITNINKVTDVDLVLWTHSTRDSRFPKSLLSHNFMRENQSVFQLWRFVSGSGHIVSLAQRRVFLTQDPPSGPTTRSKAPRSQSLFVLVRGTQSSSQRNPSFKWNISTGAFLVISDTNILSSVNIHSLHTIIWRLIPHVMCPYLFLTFFCSLLHFSLPPSTLSPFPPFRPIFHLILLFIGQISSTPLFYRSMSSPLLWEWPVFCKQIENV